MLMHEKWFQVVAMCCSVLLQYVACVVAVRCSELLQRVAAKASVEADSNTEQEMDPWLYSTFDMSLSYIRHPSSISFT